MNIGSNITFTLYDIASSVIPGAGAFLVVYYSQTIPSISAIKLDMWGVAIIGYIIGQFFHTFGSLLTKAYYDDDFKKPFVKKIIRIVDRITKAIPPQEKNTPFEIKEELWKRISKFYVYNPKEKNALKLFQIADVIASMDQFEERTVLLAREGFYRSLLGLALFLIVYFLISYSFYMVQILLTGAIVLKILFFQHEHIRRIKNNQIYLYVLLKLKNAS